MAKESREFRKIYDIEHLGKVVGVELLLPDQSCMLSAALRDYVEFVNRYNQRLPEDSPNRLDNNLLPVDGILDSHNLQTHIDRLSEEELQKYCEEVD